MTTATLATGMRSMDTVDRPRRSLEAEGVPDEGEEYRRLAETLLKETGQDRSGD